MLVQICSQETETAKIKVGGQLASFLMVGDFRFHNLPNFFITQKL